MNKLIDMLGTMIAMALDFPFWLVGNLLGMKHYYKTKLIAIFLISGFIWVPLTQIRVLQDPLGSYASLTKQAIGAKNLHKDTKSFVSSVIPDKIEEKLDRYNAEDWYYATAKTAGIHQDPFHKRASDALLSPFKAIINAIT